MKQKVVQMEIILPLTFAASRRALSGVVWTRFKHDKFFFWYHATKIVFVIVAVATKPKLLNFMLCVQVLSVTRSGPDLAGGRPRAQLDL